MKKECPVLNKMNVKKWKIYNIYTNIQYIHQYTIYTPMHISFVLNIIWLQFELTLDDISKSIWINHIRTVE